VRRDWQGRKGEGDAFSAGCGPLRPNRITGRLLLDWGIPMRPDRLLLIADLIPPGPDALEQFDVGAQVDRITDLGFNAQHIEVTDVTVGEAGVAFFASDHARVRRRDLLKEYRKHHLRRGSLDIIYFNVHW